MLHFKIGSFEITVDIITLGMLGLVIAMITSAIKA